MDEDGWSPLHAAVHWGHIELVKFLAVSGADLSLRVRSFSIASQKFIFNLYRQSRLGETYTDLVDEDDKDMIDTIKSLPSLVAGLQSSYSILSSHYCSSCQSCDKIARINPICITRVRR